MSRGRAAVPALRSIPAYPWARHETDPLRPARRSRRTRAGAREHGLGPRCLGLEVGPDRRAVQGCDCAGGGGPPRRRGDPVDPIGGSPAAVAARARATTSRPCFRRDRRTARRPPSRCTASSRSAARRLHARRRGIAFRDPQKS